jgi:hypothetical protein
MACFLVPTAEAVIVTVAAQIIKSNEKKKAPTLNDRAAGAVVDVVEDAKIALSRKLMWLANLLWGGALLLAYEHVWHGEVVPWFPFLTAASDPADAAVMLHEMSTVGVTMAILVTVVWVCIVLVADAITKRSSKHASSAA